MASGDHQNTNRNQRTKKSGDNSQYKRFIEKARELEADESGEEFESALKKILPSTDGRRQT